MKHAEHASCNILSLKTNGYGSNTNRSRIPISGKHFKNRYMSTYCFVSNSSTNKCMVRHDRIKLINGYMNNRYQLIPHRNFYPLKPCKIYINILKYWIMWTQFGLTKIRSLIFPSYHLLSDHILQNKGINLQVHLLIAYQFSFWMAWSLIVQQWSDQNQCFCQCN